VVYEQESFNRAGQELLMAQSAVSKHIQDLEASLGTVLFERSSRGVRPTKAGELLYEYALKMLRLLAEAEREIIHISQLQDRQLNVGTTPGVSVYLLPPWFQKFQLAYPNIRVSLQTILTQEVVKGVLVGRYDLGFLEGELQELDQDMLGKMRLSEIEYFVSVDASHPWSNRETISVSELADQPFINRQPSSRTRRWLEQKLDEYDIHLRNIAELDSPGTIKYALLSKMGVSILPKYAVEREIERNELHLLRIDALRLTRPLLMVWNKNQPFNPIQRAFVTLIAETIPQIQILL
jgi:DNA-binding transcriptional LysR family regulator